jgi:hypothetical protein
LVYAKNFTFFDEFYDEPLRNLKETIYEGGFEEVNYIVENKDPWVQVEIESRRRGQKTITARCLFGEKSERMPWGDASLKSGMLGTTFVTRANAEGRAVADSGCNFEVCGDVWMGQHKRFCRGKGYRVVRLSTGGQFGFGGDHGSEITETVRAPLWIQGKVLSTIIDVVKGLMPLLLSLSTMGKSGIVVDCPERRLVVSGVPEDPQERLPSGHLLIDVTKTPTGGTEVHADSAPGSWGREAMVAALESAGLMDVRDTGLQRHQKTIEMAKALVADSHGKMKKIYETLTTGAKALTQGRRWMPDVELGFGI